MDELRLYKLQENLFYGKIYWVNGDMPTSNRAKANDVKSPPSSGWSHAMVIDKGGKLVTLFCPHALEAFQVTRNCAEMDSMSMDRRYKQNEKYPINREPDGWLEWTEERQVKLLKRVLNNWNLSSKMGLPGKDYDTAALIISMMGGNVPLRILEQADQDKPKGGKEADILGLLKPVKPESKRGLVLAFFLPQPRSIREAMAEFGTTRSNILSHLFILQKEHGIGYSLSGDAATILLPEGCTDPYAEGQ